VRRRDVICPARHYQFDQRRLHSTAANARGMNTFRRFGKYLIVIGALVATLAPIYWMITISFKHEIDQFAVPPKWFRFPPTLEHYAEAFLTRSFGQYLFNRLIVAVASTVFALLLGTLAAYALARF